jgi:alpha-amylase/alpha-mannosidase (GH57 family)
MDPKKKYVCIHGHFYQPPRENAWLETIEVQDTAAPFHDWNERINFECYAPNAAARILNTAGRITAIVNNYERISFNFGPTLLSWLDHNDPTTYQAIQAADRVAQKRFGGHGSAIAQVYNHLIMPLANARDRRTQVKWGLYDFAQRFGRPAEGIWLAETAVDLATLEELVDAGIKYTILAPRQADAVRPPGGEWQTVNDRIDPRRAYRCDLPSGRSIALFFYDGNVSQGVAFEGLLNDGSRFAERIINTLDHDDTVQLAHIATDGESYGHHHKRGEMALAACLDYLDQHEGVTLTNYAQFLALFPPEWRVRIHENSSWSCVHGVERWRSDCGCHTGGEAGWNQAWRQPLREALDWLRDELELFYAQAARDIFKDPWQARDEYIQVVLDRSEPTVEAFFRQYARQPEPDKRTRIRALRLLEMQRNAMLMYTSCGWFFNEVSGLETQQILQYANRAMHLCGVLKGPALESAFVARLEKTPSNIYANAAEPYRKQVATARVGLRGVGAHFAAASLFNAAPEQLELFNYRAEMEHFERLQGGHQRLAFGRTDIVSKITASRQRFSYAVLYLGQQNMLGVLSDDMPGTEYEAAVEDLRTAFRTPDLGQVIQLMSRYFGDTTFTFWHLFRDEKKKILEEVTSRNLEVIEEDFRNIYNANYQLMLAMERDQIAPPEVFTTALRFVLNRDLETCLRAPVIDLRELERLQHDFLLWKVGLSDPDSLSHLAGERIFRELKKITRPPLDVEGCQTLIETIERLHLLGIDPNFWKSQNVYVSLLHDKQLAADPTDPAWNETFAQLGKLLEVELESESISTPG